MKLSDIGVGNNERSLQYLFDDAMNKVIANILDERTDACAKRKIKIDMEITAKNERKIGEITYSVVPVTAALIGGGEQIDILNKRALASPGGYMDGQIDYRDVIREDKNDEEERD